MKGQLLKTLIFAAQLEIRSEILSLTTWQDEAVRQPVFASSIAPPPLLYSSTGELVFHIYLPKSQ